MSQLELAHFALGGAGKGAGFKSKEFTFEQMVRDRGAVDFYKRAICPAARTVDAMGKQFLARSAFSGNQNR